MFDLAFFKDTLILVDMYDVDLKTIIVNTLVIKRAKILLLEAKTR